MMRTNFCSADCKFSWAFFILFIGIIGVIFPYILNQGLPGDLGDARLNSYVLEHFYLALTGQVDSFVDADFFYPISKTILFSDNHWGTGLIYSYFRFFNATPMESFFLWFLVGFILNYCSAFYVLRKLQLSEFSAAIGAFLFTFGLPVVAQDGHAQLIYRPLVPLASLAFFYYTKSKNFYHLSLVGLAVSSQFLISFYSGLFLVYFLLAWAGVEIAFNPKNKIKNFLPKEFCLKKSLPILAVSIFGFLLFALPYFEVKKSYQFTRYLFEIKEMLPRIQSYFLGDRSYFWFGDWKIFSLVPARWEHQMFIGVGAFLALFFLYFHKGFIEKNSLAQKFSIALLIMILGTLSINEMSIYLLFTLLPGIDSLRSVSREILVMLFPISYLVAFSLDKIRGANFVRLSSTALISIISFLIIIDPIFADKSISPTKDWENRLKLLQSKITEPLDQSSIIAVRTLDIKDEIDSMLLAQKLGIKTLNGYSGNYPHTNEGGWYFIDDCDSAKSRIDDIEYVIRSTNQERHFDRRKIIPIGFSKKCDFTTSR